MKKIQLFLVAVCMFACTNILFAYAETLNILNFRDTENSNNVLNFDMDEIGKGFCALVDSDGNILEKYDSFDFLKNKHVVVWVHGYNSVENWLDKLLGYQNSVLPDKESFLFLGVVWPGCDSFLEYFEAKDNVEKMAVFFKDALGKIIQNAEKVTLVAHSMGAYFSLKALSLMACGFPNLKKITNLLLLGAAVDDESLEKGEEFYGATCLCDKVVTCYNNDDLVLKLYKFLEFDRALGGVGTEDEEDLPSNVILVDCENATKETGHDYNTVLMKTFLKNILSSYDFLSFGKNYKIDDDGALLED